ncbi:MAG TPA: JAB domain-containing protein [Actinomycetales bacterium]|nr:JAB domain-containing protein [Actinomycetales bacterium]
MDPTQLLDLASARAAVLCRDLTAEVAGVFPVIGGRLSTPHLLGVGGPCSVRLLPSDLFRTALLYRAEQLVVVHNHLDGGPPSEADRRMTRRLRALGASLGLSLVGHVVVIGGAAHVVD